MKSPILMYNSLLLTSRLVVPGRCSDLASEDSVADDRVDEHQREDEKTLAPKHEGEAGTGCGSFVDGDDEGDHVGPERDRQGAKRRRKNNCDHVERHSVPTATNAPGQFDGRRYADCRENKQIWPLEPSAHDLKIFGERVDEDDDEEGEQSDRETGNQAIGRI